MKKVSLGTCRYYYARYYAAWIARFVSVDPLQFEYPHYTPFQYAGNKPISYIDLDGLEEKKPENDYNNKYKSLKFASEVEFKEYENYKNLVMSRLASDESSLETKINRLNKRISNLDSQKKADKIVNIKQKIKELKSSKSIYEHISNELTEIENNTEATFVIKMGKNISSKKGGGNLTYNQKEGTLDVNVSSIGELNSIQKISHELKHAYQFLEGKLAFGPEISNYTYDYQDEYEAYQRGNLFSDTLGGVSFSESKIYKTITQEQSSPRKYVSKNITVDDFKINKSDVFKNIENETKLYIENNANPRFAYKGWKNNN